MTETIFWTHEEVAAIGQKIYEERIRSIVEPPGNIGKMLIQVNFELIWVRVI